MQKKIDFYKVLTRSAPLIKETMAMAPRRGFFNAKNNKMSDLQIV